MEKDDKSRYIAGILLIISAFTHNIQLFVHGFSSHQIVAALYGAAYGVLGILIIKFKESKIILLIGIFFPTIGGILGAMRFMLMLTEENVINYFIIFHIIVDIIVVPICIYLFLQLRKKE